MLINSDVLDVSSRLREIDPDYRLYYLPERGVFELRNTKGETLLTYPYKTIDVRMVYKARETRVERSEELIKEIERNNQNIRLSAERRLQNMAVDAVKESAEEYYHAKRRRKD